LQRIPRIPHGDIKIIKEVWDETEEAVLTRTDQRNGGGAALISGLPEVTGIAASGVNRE
jgi:hypothetical protein